MPDPSPYPIRKCFQVQLGHASVLVEGHSQEEAIREARRRLCLEMPRLWDVIANLDDDRFQVAAATG